MNSLSTTEDREPSTKTGSVLLVYARLVRMPLGSLIWMLCIIYVGLNDFLGLLPSMAGYLNSSQRLNRFHPFHVKR